MLKERGRQFRFSARCRHRARSLASDKVNEAKKINIAQDLLTVLFL